MILILGLGNPGPQYLGSAHNIGFRCIDIARSALSLEEREGGGFTQSEFFCQGKRVMLVKPLTFMNLSGQIFSRFRNVDGGIEKLIVFCDNIDLAPGRIRFRYQGGSAGHNGLKSIISLSPRGNDFYRMYIGVGRETINGVPLDAAASVLRRMAPDKARLLDESCKRAVDVVLGFVRDGDVEAAKRGCQRKD